MIFSAELVAVDKNLNETTTLVTGSTDGLGRRVAQELGADGATVLLHGRSPERLEATRDACANRQAYDPRVRNKLWVLSEELCGHLLESVVRP